jgi:hypothetical protein
MHRVIMVQWRLHIGLLIKKVLEDYYVDGQQHMYDLVSQKNEDQRIGTVKDDMN